MANYIKLLDEKPVIFDIYKCFCFSEYGIKWNTMFLKWTTDGFQPLNYGERETWPINMNVTHWLKIEEPPLPILEAEKLLINTEVFFEDKDLNKFSELNHIEVFQKSGNATEFVISNISDLLLERMRSKFKSNGIRFNIKNK